MNRLLEKSEKPIFGLSPGLFLGTPEHEFLVYSIICVKTGRCTYPINYLTHFDEKWAKSVKRFLRYWRKGDFCACRHYRKIRIFGKWPLGAFCDPPCSLTSCKKSEKSNERIWRKVQKTPYFWSFWARFGNIWTQMGRARFFFQKSGFVTF